MTTTQCIELYDQISRIRKVKALPKSIENQEQKTAGGIFKKAKMIVDSAYFDELPECAYIQSGAIPNFYWTKQDAKETIMSILHNAKI